MTVDDIYNAAVLVQAIIEENDRLREENHKLNKKLKSIEKKLLHGCLSNKSLQVKLLKLY